MICTTTKGQKVGLRSVFTADVTTPVAIPAPGPARAVARTGPAGSRNSGRATPSTAAEKATLNAAAATGRDQNVPDVTAAGNYLACNLETKSELVVLIRRGDTILGQIDVDSDVRAGFTDVHHAEVKAVADALAVLL